MPGEREGVRAALLMLSELRSAAVDLTAAVGLSCDVPQKALKPIWTALKRAGEHETELRRALADADGGGGRDGD